MPRSRTAESTTRATIRTNEFVLLETRHHVHRDEAQDLAVMVGHDDRRLVRAELAEPGFDRGRTNRIALIGEQGCDPGRVGDGRGAQGDIGLDHGSDGTRSSAGRGWILDEQDERAAGWTADDELLAAERPVPARSLDGPAPAPSTAPR